MLHADRYFSPIPAVRDDRTRAVPAGRGVSHWCARTGTSIPGCSRSTSRSPIRPTLIVIPDHYVVRMLYSQGVPMEALGIPRVDGGPTETDPRRIWQLFADHFHLFRGTPSGAWLSHEFEGVFGITEPLTAASAHARSTTRSTACLARPEFRPRALVRAVPTSRCLCTTDAATDSLEWHQHIRQSGWTGACPPDVPARPGDQPAASDWRAEIGRLGAQTGLDITSYSATSRRSSNAGSSSSRWARRPPTTRPRPRSPAELSPAEAEAVFQRALAGRATPDDVGCFTGHMLIEMARMSVDDGLVMQLHPGSDRNHNQPVFERFGPDRGCDIPLATEYTRNLKPLLNKYGNDPRLTLVLFTLDETTYSRELAPLAGHYPAVRLGPPWWFHDSVEGMTRFRYQATETAGIYNTAGFNDDTRAFPSIPARHDVARRVDANFLADQVSRHVITARRRARDDRRAHLRARERTYLSSSAVKCRAGARCGVPGAGARCHVRERSRPDLSTSHFRTSALRALQHFGTPALQHFSSSELQSCSPEAPTRTSVWYRSHLTTPW